jgi:hypothetical protein
MRVKGIRRKATGGRERGNLKQRDNIMSHEPPDITSRMVTHGMGLAKKYNKNTSKLATPCDGVKIHGRFVK